MPKLNFTGENSTAQNEYLEDYNFINAVFFPLRPNCKTGYYKNLRWKLPENNSGDIDQLIRWQDGTDRIVTHNPALDEIGTTNVSGCQWGLNTGRSRIIVVDVDVKDGKLGVESLDAAEAEFGKIPRDCVVTSPSGGIHIYLRGVCSSMNGWREGIDIKSVGGMVMAAGCFTTDGQYSVTTGSIRDIPPAPMWLMQDKDLDVDITHEEIDGEWVKKGKVSGPELPVHAPAGTTPLFPPSTIGRSTTQAEVDEIWAALLHIPTSHHEDEMRVMFALKSHIMPESLGWDIFQRWASGSKYSSDHGRQWNDAQDGAVNVETIYHRAKQLGWNGMAPITLEEKAMFQNIACSSKVVPVGEGPSNEPLHAFLSPEQTIIHHKSIFDYQRVAPDDHSVLLGTDRFLERGGAAVLSAGTGIGKSTLIMQAGLMWSVGRPALGMPCNGPLRILLIQAENGEGDMEQARSSVVDTMMSSGQYTAEDIELARENFQTLAVEGDDGELLPINMATGDKVGQIIDQMGEGFDLIILDNLFSYAGCGVSEQTEMTHFLRQVINPVITRKGIGLIMIHHGNKAAKVADLDAIYAMLANSAQNGSGSGDIANWARASLELVPMEIEGHFVLMSGKRGRRMGWKDELGNPVSHKMIKHSETGICWHEISHTEMDDVKEKIQDAKPKSEKKAVVDWAEQRMIAFAEATRKKGMKAHDIYEFMSKMNGKSPKVNADNLYLKSSLEEYKMAYLYMPLNKKKGIHSNYHIFGTQKDLDQLENKAKNGEQLCL